MPSILGDREEALIACKMRAAEIVQVLLLAADGEEVLEEIDAAEIAVDESASSGLHILKWKPDAAAGGV